MRTRGERQSQALTFSRVQREQGRWSGLQAVLAFWQPLQARSVPIPGESHPDELVESGTMAGYSGPPVGTSEPPSAICAASCSSCRLSRPHEADLANDAGLDGQASSLEEPGPGSPAWASSKEEGAGSVPCSDIGNQPSELAKHQIRRFRG